MPSTERCSGVTRVSMRYILVMSLFAIEVSFSQIQVPHKIERIPDAKISRLRVALYDASSGFGKHVISKLQVFDVHLH